MSDPRLQKEAFDRGVRSKIAANVLLISVLAVLLVIFLNFGMNELGKKHDLRFDVSATKRFELTGATKRFMRDLKDPVEAYLVFGIDEHMREGARKNLSDRSFDTGYIDRFYRPLLAGMVTRFGELMSEIGELNYRVRARIINSDVERDEPVALQRKLGMGAGQMLNQVVFFNPRTKAKKAISLYSFFDIDLGGPDPTLGYRPPTVAGEMVEPRIVIGVRSVVERKRVRIGVAAGHGELPLLSVQETLTGDNFELRAVELTGEDSRIPEGCDVLLVFSPSRAWPKSAKKEILRYLESGGRIFLTQGSDSRESFAGLLERVGLKMNAVQVGHDTASISRLGKYWLYGSDLMRPVSGALHKITEATVRDTLPIDLGRSRAYELLKDFERDRVSRHLLVHSTSGAIAMPWLFDGREFRQTPEAGVRKGDLPLMLATELARGEGEAPGRLVVVGSDDWLKERSLRRRVEAANLDVFMNSIYWLTDTEQLIMGTPRSFRGSLVNLEGGRKRSFTWLTAAIFPGLFLLIGAFMYFWRRR